MNNSILCLGTNLGLKSQNLMMAREYIVQSNILIVKETKTLETEPIGFETADWFYNQLISVQHSFSPMTLLEILQGIEKKMGRLEKTSLKEYKSRIIDIDILFFNKIRFISPLLTIEHPEIYNRDFVTNLLLELQE